jgi:endophilin-A
MAQKFFNKRMQQMSEAMNKGVEKTEFDPDFQALEKQSDATKNVIEALVKLTPSYLHPNPAARAKMSIGTTVAKIKKTAAEKRYPHPSGEMAEIMLKAGGEMDDDSLYGEALLSAGEALNQINECQHAMDAEINQNFIDPLRENLEKDIKELQKQREKLKGRRLDFDYKRRKQAQGGKFSDAEIRIAEQKLEESKGLVESGMIQLLNNEVENVSQLHAFMEANLSFFRQAAAILEDACATLEDKISQAGARPKRERVEPPPRQYDDDDDDGDYAAGGDEPCATAVFDFDAENENEISFKTGDRIILHSRLDENWLEGEVHGQVGIFPSNYVEVDVDLP